MERPVCNHPQQRTTEEPGFHCSADSAFGRTAILLRGDSAALPRSPPDIRRQSAGETQPIAAGQETADHRRRTPSLSRAPGASPPPATHTRARRSAAGRGPAGRRLRTVDTESQASAGLIVTQPSAGGRARDPAGRRQGADRPTSPGRRYASVVVVDELSDVANPLQLPRRRDLVRYPQDQMWGE